ncbi:hypothetical protein ALP23_05340 [Pseudomonas syringae pv. apii]|uniref:Uncharacterized protein n=1 Tax=Pseudomonas syringae pv. apii TaxID=81036 RepID=A0A3M5WDU3_9PSED|nr:hypothetical protein ALP23_05340 [Pseudomonas syringae pv. apii]
MHVKRAWPGLETQVLARQRLTVQIDIQTLGGLEFYPRQTRTNEHIIDTQPALQEAPQRADHFLRRRQDTDVEQTIIGQCGRAQLVSTARLPTIADTQGEQIAAPVEIRSGELAMRRMQLAESGQAGKQIGGTPQHLLEVLGRVRRDLAAKPAGRHVEEQLATDLTQIDGTRGHVHQLQGFGDLQRHAGRTGKVVGSPQRQNSQAGTGFGQCQGFGDIAQGAVATTCDDVPMAGRQGFADQALGIASFPGESHVQFPALLALVCHSVTHVFIERLFTVKNEHCPALCHDTSSAEPYQLKPASDALCIIGARLHFARRMTVTPGSRKKPIHFGKIFHPRNSSSAPAGTGENHATGCQDQRLHQG